MTQAVSLNIRDWIKAIFFPRGPSVVEPSFAVREPKVDRSEVWVQ